MPPRIDSARVATPSITAARPAATTAADAALSKKAQAWITANAGDGWGKKLPGIDSGNLGLSAFTPSAAQAKALLAEAKETNPGERSLQAAKLDPAKNQLVVVLTSDDEPHLHLMLQDKKTGAMKRISEVNVIDMPSNTGDFSDVLTRVSKGAKWLPLGEGSAPANWWK